MAVQRRTVARPVNLAQASPSRLGEMKQGARLSFLREKSPRRLAQFLSEQATRPSEIPCCPCPSFWRSHLGEGEARLSEHVSPERDPSA
ncbi:hypothetical protein DEO72_LG10g1745 [Vigna unguiculata]|uniref:Uncharacterized protein n=1 Tax=Vigna unguiculata TaxID=3917 RepID=A0A4D6NEA2_VIGUN|nr:hypothetical protein DEO72_LG10g1745 [Vigna unguiculata]